MFKITVSDNAKLWKYSVTLMISGFILFLVSIFILPHLKELAIAIDSKENVPFSVWITSGGLAFLWGSFWLGFFIMFETAKKGIVDIVLK